MATITGAVLDLKRLDLLAASDSGMHRLDARAKVLVTFVFIICIVSQEKYALSALFPFFIFPAAMISLAGLPLSFIAKKIALLCPFVLIVGIFNPVFDQAVIMNLAGMQITGGWISFASILVRSILTMGAAFILVGMTGFTAVCQALERLCMPQVFAVQMLFLYRYLFVLTEESERASRAREIRSFRGKGLGMGSFGTMTGHLLLRTWQRAERIHMAMLARGFSGALHARSESRFGLSEICFVLGWSALFILLRLHNVSQVLGTLATGLLQ